MLYLFFDQLESIRKTHALYISIPTSNKKRLVQNFMIHANAGAAIFSRVELATILSYNVIRTQFFIKEKWK